MHITLWHSKRRLWCFLAGPSKTADIEQSLVIGAHGARSLVVYFRTLELSPTVFSFFEICILPAGQIFLINLSHT